MTKQEILNGYGHEGYEAEVFAEMEVKGFDVAILDLASLDDGGWQVREVYVSQKGKDDFILFTRGDGYNGWSFAEQSAEIAEHLGIDEGALKDLAEDINAEEHLNSTDWDILQQLQENVEE